MFWTHMNIAIVCFCTVCTVCTVCTTSVWCGFFFCIESEKSRKVYWFVFWLEMIILICVLAGNDNIYAFDKAFSLVAVQQCQRCSVVLRFCSWFYLTSHWNYPLWHTAIYLLPAMTYCISIHYPLRHTVYLFITRYDILYIYSLPSMTYCISIHYPLRHTVYLFITRYDTLYIYSLPAMTYCIFITRYDILYIHYPLWHTVYLFITRYDILHIYSLPATTYCISIHYPLWHTVYLFITRYDTLYIYSLPAMTHCISIHYPLSHTVYLFFACYDVLFVYSLLKNWLIAVPFMNKEVNFR